MDWVADFIASQGATMHAAGEALTIILDPTRLGFLALGAALGLILGVVPGIGGLAGTTILLPFTYHMDPYTAFAFLLGLGSTTATGDPIPAILFGVPGGAASAATVLDGHPMAKRGEAGRALAAAYMSSLMGGLFGAALLAFTIPLLQPVMLYLGSPEVLAFGILGISMVAVLSGNAPLRGLAVGCFGILIAMVGLDPQIGTQRWTMGMLYLWDGVPLLPVVLGLFALPEICDLAISRTSISSSGAIGNVMKGQLQGIKDCLNNWWLILRCSWIGGGIGSIPGISGAVVDWLAYGHALRTEKGAAQTFGKGDVRGVIASESSNNAKEGGSLVPTIAFGIPGTATMAILLGAFLVQGLIPGPEMLTTHLDITFSMVWSIAIANILGAGLCFIFSLQFAKLSMLRFTLICPCVLGIIYIGAFEASRSWSDLYTLLIFGVVGWTMKQLKWPRPPLILGFVLGDLIERYLFISISRYGAEWMSRPIVAILLAMAVIGLARPFIQDVRLHGGLKSLLTDFGAPRFKLPQLLPVAFLALLGAMMWQAVGWQFETKLVPVVVGAIAIVTVAFSLFNNVFRRPASAKAESLDAVAKHQVEQKMHMDLDSGTDHLPTRTILVRAAKFFGYLVGFMAVMAVIGLIPTAFIFVILFMRLEGRERWRLTLTYAVCMVVFITVVFDKLLALPWPSTLVGGMFPALARLIPSM